MPQFFNEEKIGNFNKILKDNSKSIPNGSFEFGDFREYEVIDHVRDKWNVISNISSDGDFAASVGIFYSSQSSYNNITHFFRDIKIEKDYPKLSFKINKGLEGTLEITASEAIYKPKPGISFTPLTSYSKVTVPFSNGNFEAYDINLSNAVDKIVRLTFSWIRYNLASQPIVSSGVSAVIDEIKLSGNPDQIIELEPSIVRIGGQLREFRESIFLNTSDNGLGGLDEGNLESSEFYNIFVVYAFKNCHLVASKNNQPKGFSSYKLIGRFRTDIYNNVENIKYSYVNDNYLEKFEFIQVSNDIFTSKIANLCVSNWENYSYSTFGIGSNWISLAYGKNRYVAVSGNSSSAVKITYSPDLIRWFPITSSYTNSARFNDIIYANDLFVAVNNSSDQNQNIAYSFDGVTWFHTSSPSPRDWVSLAYGNGVFVSVANTGVGNRVMTSSDGINWLSRATPEDSGWESITYGKGLFVAVASSGDNRVMVSSDSVNWSGVPNISPISWKSVAYGNGVFVAVANTGVDRIMVSENGINWNYVNYPILNAWSSVAYDASVNHFVVVSTSGNSDRTIVSRDGYLWSPKINREDTHSRIKSFDGEFIALKSISNGIFYSKSIKTYK